MQRFAPIVGWMEEFPDGEWVRYADAVAMVAEERKRWRAALGYAVSEADGWHDDSRGGPIEGEQMDAARALLNALK